MAKASRRKVKTDTDLKVGRESSRETWANEEKEGTEKGERRWAEKVLKP